MQGIYTMFRWVRHPQLFAAFVVISLLVAAWGAFISSQTPAALVHGVSPRLKGVATSRAATPPVDCVARPCIALTFDDGPDPAVTPAILDVLARHDAHGTFFLIGREVPGREAIIKRMYQEGNELGNHSWSHGNLTTLSPAALQHEWQSTEAAIVRAGVPAPRIFRPPYGAVNTAVRSHIPLPIVRWDVDTDDWHTRDPAHITHHLISNAHPGAIMLLHDKYPATAAALEPAIIALKQQYQFVTVSQLLGLQPGDQGQYFNR